MFTFQVVSFSDKLHYQNNDKKKELNTNENFYVSVTLVTMMEAFFLHFLYQLRALLFQKQ